MRVTPYVASFFSLLLHEVIWVGFLPESSGGPTSQWAIHLRPWAASYQPTAPRRAVVLGRVSAHLRTSTGHLERLPIRLCGPPRILGQDTWAQPTCPHLLGPKVSGR